MLIVLASVIRKEKEIKDVKTGKEDTTLSLFVGAVMLHVKKNVYMHVCM